MRLIHKVPLRVLDFDCECRPLSWYGMDQVSREITAIACQFTDQKRAHVWLLGKHDPIEMLEAFREQYDSADIVTGHFIRGFDLPVLNSALTEYGLPPLADKLTSDTKLDLIKWSGISKSQENIAATLGIESPKITMSQTDWREANRLTPQGLALTRRRVVGDVRQHIEMRERLLELKMLRAPKTWSSTASGMGRYTP